MLRIFKEHYFFFAVSTLFICLMSFAMMLDRYGRNESRMDSAILALSDEIVQTARQMNEFYAAPQDKIEYMSRVIFTNISNKCTTAEQYHNNANTVSQTQSTLHILEFCTNFGKATKSLSNQADFYVKNESEKSQFMTLAEKMEIAVSDDYKVQRELEKQREIEKEASDYQKSVEKMNKLSDRRD